jgi:hypothetical protein
MASPSPFVCPARSGVGGPSAKTTERSKWNRARPPGTIFQGDPQRRKQWSRRNSFDHPPGGSSLPAVGQFVVMASKHQSRLSIRIHVNAVGPKAIRVVLVILVALIVGTGVLGFAPQSAVRLTQPGQQSPCAGYRPAKLIQPRADVAPALMRKPVRGEGHQQATLGPWCPLAKSKTGTRSRSTASPGRCAHW